MLWVGVEHGSASFGDIQFTLAVTPPGQRTITADTTPATAKPDAPTDVKLTYDPSVARGQLKISWTDTDASVDYFRILRSNDGGTNYTQVGTTAGGNTSYTDTSMSQSKTYTNGPWTYKIVAVNSVGTSTSAAETVQAIGGPDVTADLLEIRIQLRTWYFAIPAAQQNTFQSEWVTSVAGAAWDYLFDPQKVEAANVNWDIVPLASKKVSAPGNSGVLPDGTHTVTVFGHVYSDEEVNYWLYGVLGGMVGWNQQDVENLVKEYRIDYWKGTGIPGREDWMLAGWTDRPALPAYSRFPQWLADAIIGVNPASPLPSGGPLYAFAGYTALGPKWSGTW
jgi:hypothetical protein